MCFSAGASFTAGALLIGAGIIAIKKNDLPAMRVFACTPALFGVQQLAEGVVWLTNNQPHSVNFHKASIYIFLLIAQVIWPVWVPLSVWLMEPEKERKKIIGYCMLLGFALGASLIYFLFAYDVSAIIREGHIKYYFYFPSLTLRRILYFMSAILPLFVSGLRWMKWFGGAFFGSLIFSFIFYTQYVISVWCFFAAILSVMVIVIIANNREAVKSYSIA